MENTETTDKNNWIEQTRLMNESKKQRNNSRFIKYLVKHDIIDKSSLDWVIVDDIKDYWKRNRKSRGHHSFDKDSGHYTGVFRDELNG